VLEFFISVVIGSAVALGWLAIWIAALRLLAIRTLSLRWTPEARAARREHIVRMGKARHILLFGMLGYGLAMGLATTTALALAGAAGSWPGATFNLVFWIVVGGWCYGIISWNNSFRGATPFPPPFLIDRRDADQKNP